MGSLAWKSLAAAATIVAATVAERGAEATWRAATGEEPPVDPSNPNVGWSDAIGWAVLSGTAVALARVWATRRAARYYEESSGKLPKPYRADAA